MPVSLRENIYQARKLPQVDAVLMGRAELLLPQDRALIEAVLVKGQSAITLGELINVSPKVIRKRVHTLSRRLASRKFLNAARALAYLEPSEARLARKYYCQGLSCREICQQESLSPYKLRRRLDRIDAQISTIKRLRQAGGQLAVQNSQIFASV